MAKAVKAHKQQAPSAAKQIAIYLRVSTGGQTTANQRRELGAVAKRHGWSVVAVFEDAAKSGAKDPTNQGGIGGAIRAPSIIR